MVPVVLTLLAGIGLHRRCSRGSAPGTGVAWGAVAVLAALTVLGAASIGFYLLPITVLLATAVALTPSGAPPLTRR
jgi:hypothetical protein